MKNIIVFSLDFNISSKIAERLSECLEYYYFNVEDYFKYRIPNPQEVSRKCGLNYLQTLQNNALIELNDYENTIVSCPVSLLMSYNLINELKTKYNFVYVNIENKDNVKNQNELQFYKDYFINSIDNNDLKFQQDEKSIINVAYEKDLEKLIKEIKLCI